MILPSLFQTSAAHLRRRTAIIYFYIAHTIFLAKHLTPLAHYDSALYYGRLALITANKMSSPVKPGRNNKTTFFAFQRSGRLDSAFVYQEIAMNAKDSLTSLEKERKYKC